MSSAQIGFSLLLVAALSSGIVPIVVDGFLMARAHMLNPRWLPHAKLHCAMSFFGALFLSGGSIALLLTRPPSDKSSMVIAAFLATGFWFGLLLSGLLPMTSYTFKQDPANYMPPPQFLKIPVIPNVAAAMLFTVCGWVGLYLYIS